MDILMLDIEGVMVFNRGSLNHLDYVIRPYARGFIHASGDRFDEIWACTCAPEAFVDIILRKELGFDRYRFWNWSGKKTNGYERFEGHRVVHVEDGVPDWELDDLVRFGVHYIQVPTYYGDPSDDGLLHALNEVSMILT